MTKTIGILLLEFLLVFRFRGVRCFSAVPSDIVSTFSLRDDGGGTYSNCYEVKTPPLPAGADEDEVDLWYPTRRRSFLFGGGGGAEEGNSAENVPNDKACPQHVEEQPVTVRQTSFGCGKLGATVWPSSLALCLHLAAYPQRVRGRRVLELGAGCGLPSRLCVDVLGADAVLATDFWELNEQGVSEDDRKEPIPARLHGINLEYNVQGGGAQVQRVDWHDADTVADAKSFGADLIVGSDLVYYPSNVQPLIDTLQALMTEEGGASEALLIAPLPPQAERTALPDFRKQLPAKLDRHSVEMDEFVMQRREDGEEQRFLKIVIVPKGSS